MSVECYKTQVLLLALAHLDACNIHIAVLHGHSGFSLTHRKTAVHTPKKVYQAYREIGEDSRVLPNSNVSYFGF